MLTCMDTSTLLRETRRQARLSIRALSAQAGVSASTVSRIEAGRMDPTVGMLTRLLDAVGYDLDLTARASTTPRLASLTDAWEPSPRGDAIDWTRLRAFLDRLHLHPEDTARSIHAAPEPSGSALLDNLLAGIAETLADDARLPRPDWTAQVPRLREAWTTPGTARTQETARATTPSALAARGLTLARSSLWRDRPRAE